MPSDRSKNSGHGAGGPTGPEPGSGAYMPGGHKSSTIRPAYMNDGDSSGIGSGLCCLKSIDTEALAFPRYSSARNPLTGNGPERPNPYADSAISVTSKGHSMTIC